MGIVKVPKIGDAHRAGPVIGFFPGNWDLVHPGHIRAFKEAKEHCDYLIVGIKKNNKDKKNKNEPIMSLSERLEVLEAIKYIDKTLVYTTERDLFLLDRYLGKWDIRFMGADHQGKKHHPIKAKIVYISRNHKWSSSELRNRIKNA